MVETVIKLFESTATSFETNGLGYLSDALSCDVVEERNGSFELTMKYPVTGLHYSDIQNRRIIVAKSNPYAEPQPFRIYSITRPINGKIMINAAHISYDTDGILLQPFSAEGIQNTLISFKTHAIGTCPFNFWSDKNTSGQFVLPYPESIRSRLGGTIGSLLDLYRGEYEFDRYDIKLWNNRGANRGVEIRYGKNMTNVECDEDWSNVYTAVLPWWYSDMEENGGLVQGAIVNCPGTFNFSRVLSLDCSYDFMEKPTGAQLEAEAQRYIESNSPQNPKMSIEVSFVNLTDSEEYQNLALLEEVHLCDEVTVDHQELGIKAVSKCIKTDFNVLTGKYNSIELGESRSSLSSSLAESSSSIEDLINDELASGLKKETNDREIAIKNATKLITGNLGGYVIIRSSTGGDYPDEILVMDTPDIKTAKKIWRWNNSGLGYSKTGYSGPYGLAMTQDGVIVADFITAGQMSASLIRGGTLALGGRNNANGILTIYNANNAVIGQWDNTGLRATGDLVLSKVLSNVNHTGKMGEVTYWKRGYEQTTMGLSIDNSSVLTSDGLYTYKWLTLQPTIPYSEIQKDQQEWFDITLVAGVKRQSSGIEVVGTSPYFSINHWYGSSTGAVSYPIISCYADGGNTDARLTDMSYSKVLFRGDNGYGVYIYAQNQTTSSPNVTLLEEGNNTYKFRVYRSASSSKRYKNILRDMTNEDVKSLYSIQPVLAEFKEDYISKTDERYHVPHPMFIAEDVEKYFPEAADHNGDGSVENWNIRIMVPAIFQMIKDLKAEIEELKRR